MANENEIMAAMIEKFGNDLVNEANNLGLDIDVVDDVTEVDAYVFFTGVRDAKNGRFNTEELGYCSQLADDTYLKGWQAYLEATKSKKRQFTVNY